MNVAAEQSIVDPLAELKVAHARRAAAHAQLDTATQASARARQTRDAAAAEAARLQAEEQDWVSRHATRLQAWITSGHSGQPPVAAANDKSYLAQRTAQATAAAAAQALTALEAVEVAARQELSEAEMAIATAVNQLFAAEAEALARSILNLRTELLRLSRELSARVGGDLHRPINALPTPSALVTEARQCARHLALQNEINTPVNVLRGITRRSEAESAALEQRRQRLLAGNFSTEESSP